MGPSWKTLQAVVEGKAVDPGLRSSLVSKMTGLMGERAAARMVQNVAFAEKYLKRAGESFELVRRGVPYRGGSMDIAAYGRDNQLLVGEVKNWSVATWSQESQRVKLIDQLRRHDGGIYQLHSATDRMPSEVAGKVLFVAEEGYEMMAEALRLPFEEAIQQLGWSIEKLRSDRIGDFGSLIDDLR